MGPGLLETEKWELVRGFKGIWGSEECPVIRTCSPCVSNRVGCVLAARPE